MNPTLFFDIDGVLNGHSYDKRAESSTIDPKCVERMNRVILATRCELVVISAWRYMVLNGAMTLKGFEYMLRTHRLMANDRLIGHTRKDYDVDDKTERGRQVKEWLAEHPGVTTYAIVDDLRLGFDGMPFVQTNEKIGLTDEDADELIRLLGGAT